jgi:selenocysteine lyase/cysteine desulfurase
MIRTCSDKEQQGNMTTEISSNDDIAYFNHAGQALLSAAVREAGIKAIQKPPWGGVAGSTDQKRVRELFASLIEAEASQIAMTPSTAFAMTLAATNIQRTLENKKGRILVLQDQFDSAIYPWQNVCDASNGDITLDIVQYPTDDGGWTEAILRKLEDPGILVACLPPLHWTDGALIDLEVIGQACRKTNISLIVDATQGKFLLRTVLVATRIIAARPFTYSL